MKNILAVVSILFFGLMAHGGFDAYQSTTHLGLFNTVKCNSGLTCTKVGDKLNMVTSGTFTSGITASAGQMTHYRAWAGTALTSGTSTTPGATTVYMTQIFVHANATLTGIKINNAGTVGTDKYIAALFNSSGTPVAYSALAGTTTAGASVYQALPFTSTYAAVGPGVYWIALYVNGTTDRFYSVPAVGENSGLAGSVTGQTFGTVAAVTLPTTFTADKGPVAFTY